MILYKENNKVATHLSEYFTIYNIFVISFLIILFGFNNNISITMVAVTIFLSMTSAYNLFLMKNNAKIYKGRRNFSFSGLILALNYITSIYVLIISYLNLLWRYISSLLISHLATPSCPSVRVWWVQACCQSAFRARRWRPSSRHGLDSQGNCYWTEPYLIRSSPNRISAGSKPFRGWRLR